jgi:hypothetical protein
VVSGTQRFWGNIEPPILGQKSLVFDNYMQPEHTQPQHESFLPYKSRILHNKMFTNLITMKLFTLSLICSALCQPVCAVLTTVVLGHLLLTASLRQRFPWTSIKSGAPPVVQPLYLHEDCPRFPSYKCIPGSENCQTISAPTL